MCFDKEPWRAESKESQRTGNPPCSPQSLSLWVSLLLTDEPIALFSPTCTMKLATNGPSWALTGWSFCFGEVSFWVWSSGLCVALFCLRKCFHCSPRLAGNYNSQAGSELPVTLIIPQPPKQASLQPKGHLFSSAETLSLVLDLSQNNPNGQLLIQILSNPVSHPLQVPCWVWIVKAAERCSEFSSVPCRARTLGKLLSASQVTTSRQPKTWPFERDQLKEAVG